MRTLIIAGSALALLVSDGALAQRVVQHGPGSMYPAPIAPRPMVGQPRTPRWGSKVDGRWWGGANAPGGWRAYRRPTRGWALPTYWVAPRFYVGDWATYNLPQPPYGYNWVRYYDDAVLIDARGSVYDTMDGVDWDRYDRGSYAHDDGGYHDDRPRDGLRRDDGLGGAAIGAVAGGVAGNVIAGRGNRLGGTLIGAGVGAAAGYAIDKREDRGRRRPPPPPPVYDDYGAGYDQYGYPPSYHMPSPYREGNRWTSPDGGTTVLTTIGGYGAGTTTVTVQTAPVVTTTTTEIYEDTVTWSRPTRKNMWRRKPVCHCR